MTEVAPNALVMLQTKLADPLSPSMSVSAVLDPMRAVNAATSRSLFSIMDRIPRLSEAAEVEFGMIGGRLEDKCDVMFISYISQDAYNRL
jgi:hypothetical protein